MLFCLLLANNAAGQECQVSIENVFCDFYDINDHEYKLLIDRTAGFEIRLTADCLPSVATNVQAGFKLYSPDGAQLNLASAESYAAFEDLNWIMSRIWVHPVSPEDTILFDITGVSFSADVGLYPGFDEVVGCFWIHPELGDLGKHICLDSSFTPPGGVWRWLTAGGDDVYPQWYSSPQCWEIYLMPCRPLFPGNVLLRPDCVGDCLQGPVDVGDLTNLIDHLFISSTPLCNASDADINFDWSVDIADLTNLIDHLYISFAPLESCY